MEFIYKTLASIMKPYLVSKSKKAFPVTNETLFSDKLEHDVTITRDTYGIPHISGQAITDVMFAQGYVHAQDRLWQMELNRRTAKGELSEIFGKMALTTDRTARTFGFARLGLQDYESLSDTSKKILEAYIDGINFFLSKDDLVLPVEFSLIHHKPKPWELADVLALSRLMMWQLSHAWYSKLIRADIIAKAGPELATELEINNPNDQGIILPDGIDFNILDASGILKKVTGPFLDRNAGSNSIAISGKYTASGKPILANDMHLAVTTPALWYMNHLEFPDNFSAGVTVPGLPAVLVGHNKYFGWTATLAFTDCADLFIEKIDKEHKTYEFKGEQRPLTVFTEEIHIKDKNTPVHTEEVLCTDHGIIISDIIATGEYALAVKDTALSSSPAMDGFFQLNTGKNWNDFVAAVKLITIPQLNVSYADVEGNIGYWCTGTVPIRSNGKSFDVPVAGWTGEYDWTGFVPFEEMPHAFNPERGFIVTANNKVIPDDFPRFLGNVWMNGYRSTVLTNLLSDAIKDNTKITASFINKALYSTYCLPAVELAEHIDNLQSTDSDVMKAQDILSQWDKHMSKDSVGATLYEVIRYTLFKNLIVPTLGNDLTESFMGAGFEPILLPSHEFYGHDTTVLLRLLNNPQSLWIQQAGGKDAILTQSIKDALKWLKKELGPIRSDWQWGNIHQALFPHAFDIKKPLNYIFNPKAIGMDGTTDTPKQSAMYPNAPYHNRAWSISYRQLLDFGDDDEPYNAMLAPGQSGLLSHPHYDDLIPLWERGDHIKFLANPSTIKKFTEGKIDIIKYETTPD